LRVMYVPEDDGVDVDGHRVFRERPLGIKGSGLDAFVDDGDDALSTTGMIMKSPAPLTL
jgi:hypothetical protein